MKMIFHSNAPHAPTGYGRQTALFAPMIAEHYDLAISANYGVEAAPISYHGIPVLPGLGGSHVNETLPGHVSAVFDHPRDGLVVTLYDIQVFDPEFFKRVNSVFWTPVDSEPPPPHLISVLRESSAIPLAMSRFGEEQLAEFDPLYCPHGVDADIYKPTPSDVREQMGIPEDGFLIGVVGANKGRQPSRKSFQQILMAFREFRKRHENAYIYLHTVMRASYAQGEDLPTLMASLELPVESVKYPNQYSMVFAPLGNPMMARIFSAFDVHLAPSMGEGFGVPTLEAAACGTPSIVSNFSAQPEVAGEAGWKVGGTPYWTAQATWMMVPDVKQIVAALEDAYAETASERASRSKAVRDHALTYAAPKVFDEFMLPALKEAEDRFGARAPLKLVAA